MFLDKTGTLTAGKLAVTSWLGDLDAAPLAAAVEAGSAHPIARALVAHAEARGTATAIEEELGRGISGIVGSHRITVGAPAWVRARTQWSPTVDRWVDDLAEHGETPVVIAVDKRPVAVAGLRDPLRPDARAALERLAAFGWRLELLSGDDPRVVARVGTELGLPFYRCHGGASPEAKAARVAEAKRSGPVVMLGDGVNDAAAMAAATAGIAVSGAAEIAVDTADIYLKSPAIAGVAATVDGARATLATIRRNLRLSLLYNLTAGGLAIAGVIHPLIAAAVMPLSSLTVLVSSLRSRAFREAR
jgi:P-type E1-E2 ATPase